MGKLDGVIGDRLKTLETADPQQAQRLESEVKYLQQQLKQHRRTFKIQDESDGVGFVAMADLPPSQKQDLMAISQQFGSREFNSIVGQVGGVQKAVEILNRVDQKVGGDRTVKFQIDNVVSKLKAKTRIQAIHQAYFKQFRDRCLKANKI